MKKLIIFLYLTISYSAFATNATQNESEPVKTKAVLVTGASSGIGFKITQYLVKNGFYVYAGARKDADLKRLEALDNVSSIKLDVTSQNDIDAAVIFVKKQGRGLFGIVNNAGVGTFDPMSQVDDKDILWIHDVNVMGPHRVNRAFIPMLKASKGRTLIIGSISGYLTGATSGAYSMSKFAVEAYTESLAEDLAESEVQVAIIEPGGYRSKIREKVAMHNLTGKYQLDQKLSVEQQQELQKVRENNQKLKEPDEVAEAVILALTSIKPRLRYMVAPTKEQAEITVRTAMSRALQLNSHQPYQLSREQLVKLMDELLQEQ